MAQPPVSQFSGIFVSYRRDDSSGHAGRLFDNLARHFGEDQLFMDIDTIEPGEDFVEVIEKAVGSCEIVVAVMGQRWLSASDGTARRLDNPNDFVRLEIATALKRGVRLIPVLVQKATMPNARDLPDDIALLSRRNAIEISDSRWQYDVAKLISVLEKVLAVRQQEHRAEASRQAEEERQRQEEEKRRAAEVEQQRNAKQEAKLHVAEDEEEEVQIRSPAERAPREKIKRAPFPRAEVPAETRASRSKKSIPPKPELTSHGIPDATADPILFHCNAYKRFTLRADHKRCKFAVRASGVMFLDRENPSYTFKIPTHKLRTATFTKPGLLGSDDDLRITLKDGSVYDIGLDKAQKSKAVAAIKKIIRA